ncbi:hypothetical protein I4I73_10405 [Pseudonocardia sp. KRD-184]|uniref:Uncharacterized protein n=1 Tax=Pseudonocardia oceani TaxID=2792013 RepID=A0ABS6UCA8_9PSEU|nr:hypothetical protein [Pseudonocardia oceani]MBW0089370.1 hypothetical protein [Pseudonocardia oceani]MBW0096398.1 hypothetical protein [Pseudonocardia oceani]MBW0108732.1 hypothetical protein [Pseudonocardia oceani]MBW0123309.1 hypothetical protein [Pseudonocardia oceani]MBW0129509.1 hypothetical protein [Pseudonocardia oceani]
MSTLVLPSWVVPDVDAVRECERVSVRRLGLGPRAVTARDAGVAAALAWLTIGEVSPLTHRAVPGTLHPDGSWTPGATWELVRAESWVALCVAAGALTPTEEDWRRLGVEPAPAAIDDAEFAYGAWRTLAWLLGVREDFPIYTSWHRAASIRRDRRHLYGRRPAERDAAWRAAEQAARDQARADARRHWEHVRARVDATA